MAVTHNVKGAHMAKLSSLGTGLLLGAALGIIIPEGVETLASSRPSTPLEGTSIALPLLFGFTFMLVIEQFSSSHAHHHHTHRLGHHAGVASRDSVFDVELAGLESEEEDIPRHRRASTARTNTETDSPPPAYPITIGLIVHGLADGLALGMSVLSNDDSSSSYSLSLVVFLALAVHKAPTALAYTVSLMSTSLSRVECRKHLLLFSASTPVGAITSYASFVFFGLKKVEGVGTALLISAGSFLYVATVLQPVSRDHSSTGGVSTRTRVFLLVLGIFTPFMLGTLLDHEHNHSPVPVPQ
jgi:zinc transporter 9